MHIRNRISDIKKIRCNACQDYLKMVAVEDWKNQLYEKTQIAVKYSPAKYKPAYKIMRTRGIENYEIDDMDVTFISEVIHKCSYIFPSKVETRKAKPYKSSAFLIHLHDLHRFQKTSTCKIIL